jgi:mRNA-degrading endonuclease RelE of RelBE toxin-antitoxin system
MSMMRRVLFKPQALEHLRWLPVRAQRVVTDGIRRHLAENDPTLETRHKFRLRRESPTADYKLRLGNLRVLYRVEDAAVFVVVIGTKRRNALVVPMRSEA